MLLQKRVFRTIKNDWISGNIMDECDIFRKWVRRHFELPKKVSRVTISLHSTFSLNRVKGKVESCPCGCSNTTIVFGRVEFWDTKLSEILRPLRGRAVYLGVEYE